MQPSLRTWPLVSDQPESWPQSTLPDPPRLTRASTFAAPSRLTRALAEPRARLRRQLSSFQARLSARFDTFRCPVCCENIRVADRFVFVGCGREAHGACTVCTRTWFTHKVEENNLDSLGCVLAGQDSCEAEATQEELQRLLGPELFGRYERFRQVRQNPDLRECPQCSTLCTPQKRRNGGLVREMQCSRANCGFQFCHTHANAHPPGRRECRSYEREELRRLRFDPSDHNATPCPHCGIPTVKTSGCNHMTCAQCHGHWCWVCGVAIADVNAVQRHYTASLLGCDQFAPRQTQSVWLRPLKVLFLVLVALILLLLAPACLVLLLTTAPLWPLGCCCPDLVMGGIMAVGALPVLATFVPLFCSWAALVLILWLPCVLFGSATEDDLATYAAILPMLVFDVAGRLMLPE